MSDERDPSNLPGVHAVADLDDRKRSASIAVAARA